MTDASARDSILRDAQVLHLTTTSRRTNAPRRVELWFAFHDRQVELLSHARSHWYRNARDTPPVQVEAGGATWQGDARMLDPAEIPAIMERFRAKYGDAAVRQWYGGTERVAVRVAFRG